MKEKTFKTSYPNWEKFESVRENTGRLVSLDLRNQSVWDYETSFNYWGNLGDRKTLRTNLGY